jgi:serine/threonine protein phosphatase PrpC
MLTKEELEQLVQDIRQQASTWLGDEASEKIERLIAHTMFLRGHHDNIQAMLVNGYRMVQIGADTRKS